MISCKKFHVRTQLKLSRSYVLEVFKITHLLHQFTSMEFTEVINNGDSLTWKTKMDLQ